MIEILYSVYSLFLMLIHVFTFLLKQEVPQHLTTLAFSTANPRHSAVLQTWPSTMKMELRVFQQPVLLHNNRPVEPTLPAATDDLDPLILEAFRAVMSDTLKPSVAVLPDIPGIVQEKNLHTYMVLNEGVLRAMCQRGWDRSHGSTRLVPTAVAMVCSMPPFSADMEEDAAVDDE